MNRAKFSEWSGGVKALSLLLAALLWLGVALERKGELKLMVPLRPKAVPAGFRLESPLPEQLEVTVSGPRILLCRLPFSRLSCGLDLDATAAGTLSFAPRHSSLGLDRELSVVRILPASMRLTLVKETQVR